MKQNKYNFLTFKGDFFGGITAGIVALPLALAFGAASGAGAKAGLYGAVALGFFSAVFGGTKSQISGPTGPMTVVTASAMLAFHGDISKIAAVIIVAGVVQILMGLLQGGKLVRYMPYPVISGFMTGIGVIIIILQINPFLGTPTIGSTAKTILNIFSSISSANSQAVFLSVMSLSILYLTPKIIARAVPTPLIALIAVSLVSVCFDMKVPVIGEIPSGLPEFVVPSFSFKNSTMVLSFAISLGLLGAIDSLLTSLVSDSITKTRHNPNQELIGQGIGNIAAAFCGGIAGAGATMRTVVNVKAGGSTKLSGVIHALFLLCVLLWFADYASVVPMAALSGILIKVGIDIIDYRFLKVLGKAPKSDLYIMLAVLVLTVFVDLIIAVMVGVVLACIMLTMRMIRQFSLEVTEVGDDKQDGGHARNGVRVVTIDGPFFFGTTSQIVGKAEFLLNTKAVIFDCHKVPFVDISASFALEETIAGLKGQGIETFVVACQNKGKNKYSLKGILPDSRIFTNLDDAVLSAKTI